MNWLSFVVSLVAIVCVMLLWQAFDTWIQQREIHLGQVVTGLALLVIAIPVVWLVPTQSDEIFYGTLTGLLIAAVVDGFRRRELKRRTARP